MEIKEDDEPTRPEISVHVLSGIATPHTLRITGLIDRRRLHILIDSGSTQFCELQSGQKAEMSTGNNFSI